jgi:4-hydroxy-2-oxoheptanedioate aldolase
MYHVVSASLLEDPMRVIVALSLPALVAMAVLSSPVTAQNRRLNPVIAAQEKGEPIFGIMHPAITRGGGRGRGAAAPDPSAPPPPPIDLAAAAKETVGFTGAHFLLTSGTSDTFLDYLAEIRKAGGSMRTHPFSAKIGIWHRSPENVKAAIERQLNAGHVNVSMEAVESPQEVRDVIKAMRLTSAGGTRPETGLEKAAAYWGLSIDEYKKKADVWPLNKNGELLITVIIESVAGLEHVREIAAEPGVAQIAAGYGTLGGVFKGDQDARERAAQTILAACKAAKVPCAFPVNTPAELEQRKKEGWSIFILQRRDENAFAAIEAGRRSGTP